MTSKLIKILYLEDIETDVFIVKNLLEREAYRVQLDHVTNEPDFTEKLLSEKYDLVLTDFNLPGFNGVAAILVMKRICPEIPVICISGTIGEEMAIELIHLGASDYILKDKLFKLPVAIQRVLKEVENAKARNEAEKELKKSIEKYQNLVENINDVIYEIDANGTITYMSPAIYPISGHPAAYYTEKSILDFIHPEDKQETIEKLGNIIQKGLISPFEFRIYNNKNETIHLRTSSKPIILDGKTTGIRGIASNVTKSKIAEESLRKLSRAVEQSPVSIIITDLSGTIEYINPQTELISGYNRDELIGKNLRIISSNEKTQEEYSQMWESLKAGKEWTDEFHNIKKNGQFYWEMQTISPIYNEKGILDHFLVVKGDLSEQKNLMEQLIHAKEKAESSDKLKTAFLNNISHEVRTPLNGILGFSQFLIQPDLPKEKREQFVDILNKSSERLVNTITNYMDISLIVSGTMTVSPGFGRLNVLLEKLYQKYLQDCSSKKLELVKLFRSEENLNLHLDFGLLEKALTHLLDNALKFTKEGKIWIESGCVENEVFVIIGDTGMGIEKEAQKHVFQIFVQEDLSSTRAFEGSGLGLSIAKGLIELCGGRIAMETEKGKGTTFHISFPHEKISELKTKSQKPSEIKNLKQNVPCILIVEDDENNSALIQMILERFSIKFLTAVNGKEAVDIIKEDKEINLILMDIKMPVMDGLEATRIIKGFSKNIPVIGLSAFALTGDKEKALKAGCDHYLTKPVKTNELINAISLFVPVSGFNNTI